MNTFWDQLKEIDEQAQHELAIKNNKESLAIEAIITAIKNNILEQYKYTVLYKKDYLSVNLYTLYNSNPDLKHYFESKSIFVEFCNTNSNLFGRIDAKITTSYPDKAKNVYGCDLITQIRFSICNLKNKIKK